jgi:hypothetical protein
MTAFYEFYFKIVHEFLLQIIPLFKIKIFKLNLQIELKIFFLFIIIN